MYQTEKLCCLINRRNTMSQYLLIIIVYYRYTKILQSFIIERLFHGCIGLSIQFCSVGEEHNKTEIGEGG